MTDGQVAADSVTRDTTQIAVPTAVVSQPERSCGTYSADSEARSAHDTSLQQSADPIASDTTAVKTPEPEMWVVNLAGDTLGTTGSVTARSVSWLAPRYDDYYYDYNYYDDWDQWARNDTVRIEIPAGTFPVPKALSAEADAPASRRDAAICTSTHLEVDDGLDAVMTESNQMPDSVLVGGLLLFFVFIAMNFGEVRRLFKNFGQDVWSVRRRRGNAFDDRTTNENRTLGLLMLMASGGEGIFMADACGIEPSNVGAVGLMAAIALGYNVFQLLCYILVGYVFTDQTGKRQWLRGYVSSQSMLGLLLLPAGLVALVHPGVSEWMMWGALGLFVSARLVFIAKGVKIFYQNLPSLVYFILYLCALEIIPLLIACGGAASVASRY
ncbi:MAG: DUF4271 domain-containing protein [Muribaculaceae bacterium]|nr:DUF4271 domain-containing protein [Muribaculaceae bacterium]